MDNFEKIARAGMAARFLSGARKAFGGAGSSIRKAAPSWKSTAIFGGGALGGAGAAMAAPSFMNKAREFSTLQSNKGSLSFTNASKTTLRWKTYPGGPILEGPKNEMIRVIRLGKSNREAGIKELLRLIKSGVIRKVGTV